MSYPVAYRSGSRKYGNAPRSGAKAFKLPRPYTVPTLPPGSNDNFPTPANSNRDKARALARLSRAGRIIARRLPYLGYAFLAYDIYRLFQGNDNVGVGPVIIPTGFSQCSPCPGAMPPTHYVGQAGGCSAGPFVCLNGQVGPMTPLTTPLALNFQRVEFGRRVHNPLQVRYFRGEHWAKAGSVPSSVGTVLAYRQMKNREWVNEGKGNYVLDPMNLPIRWPVPLPQPVPTPLISRRLNHPFIRQTGNEPQPNPGKRVEPPRRPPPEGQKERKLVARGGVLRAFVSAARVAHVATEVIDIVEAFHSALPKAFQAKPTYHDGRWWKASPQAKAQAVYDNVDQIDWYEAAVNLAKNEVGDRVLGRANAMVDKGLNQTPVGRINRGIAF